MQQFGLFIGFKRKLRKIIKARKRIITLSNNWIKVKLEQTNFDLLLFINSTYVYFTFESLPYLPVRRLETRSWISGQEVAVHHSRLF